MRVGPVLAGTFGGLVAGFVLWVLGVDWPVSAAVVLFGVAAGLAWAGFADGQRPVLVRPQPEPRPGTRGDVTQIAWALRGRHGEIGDAARKRLRAFARSRLARHGIDLDDAAHAAGVADLIGPDAAALLDGAARTVADVQLCLDRLEALGAHGRPPARRGEA